MHAAVKTHDQAIVCPTMGCSKKTLQFEMVTSTWRLNNVTVANDESTPFAVKRFLTEKNDAHDEMVIVYRCRSCDRTHTLLQRNENGHVRMQWIVK